MMKNTILFLIGITIFMFGASSVFAQKGRVVEKTVEFARGRNSAVLTGVVDDRLDSHIFYLKAKAGQTMTVRMTSPRPLRDAYLVVNFPLTENGENETVSNKRGYTIKLPRDGKYEIYIEAIRDKIPYTINVSIK
ncbi:MAG: hypothetical protein H7Z37_18430 [Pyrinomonadaceae bacterium]|nr:hypothetical protein [Pyrinomonadaceae bacterium]